MIQVYADRGHLPDGIDPVVLLQPFWGAAEDVMDPTAGRFAAYAERASDVFRLSDAASADLHVFPVPYESIAGRSTGQEALTEFLETAARHDVPAVVFFCSDSDEPLPTGNAYVFRTSFHRSSRQPRHFALPGWSEDFVAAYLGGQLHIRRKTDKPVIGFCGYAASLAEEVRFRADSALGRTAGVHDRRYGPVVRAQALRALRRSRAVACNFDVKANFWAGALEGEYRATRLRVARLQFVCNLLDSDYILCARGAGNFSYRVYETLSCGRIPVLIDTDCVLPFDDIVDWRRYCVWVDAQELSHIGEIVAEFHASIGPREFEELQRACRRLWEDRISPLGFFQHLHEPLLT